MPRPLPNDTPVEQLARLPYFAYGSNLLAARLRQHDRCPEATPVARAVLEHHRLTFHKRSNVDGSGKCDVEPCAAEPAEIATDHTALPFSRVEGVVFDLPADEIPALHRAEGLGHGYDLYEVDVKIVTPNAQDELRRAFCYRAQPEWILPGLVPMSWYLDLVSAGATEHDLPPEYRAALAEIPTQEDTDTQRDAWQRRALP